MDYNSKKQCEYIRHQAKQKFESIKGTWIEAGEWALPHRTRWLKSQTEGERNNKHIVDATHVLALRSYVAGFLEGNTSATRPWFRIGHQDPDLNLYLPVKEWLEKFQRRCLITLTSSNFYHAAGQFYYDRGVYNTGAHYIEELNGGLHFHTLMPGSYYCINNNLGVADILVREFTLTVKALVDSYGVKINGKWDWSNFSNSTKNAYLDGSYTSKVDVVQIIKRNEDFDPTKPIAGDNRQWVSKTYETGGDGGGSERFGPASESWSSKDKFLRVSYSQRKPFIVGRSESSDNYEYGEKGPTTDALGLIKSLNKKAISKDIAIEQILKPTMQGPASLKKSYITNQSNHYIPLDPTSLSLGGMKPVNNVNPAIGTLIQDVEDMRRMVDKLYYADFLLYLSQNPKTRTATETNAILQEQQMVIGPNLQSLNWTYNDPVVEFIMDYVLDTDPYIPPPPPELQGQYLRTEMVSVFAQAQKAADLPSVDRYMATMANLASLNPSVWDKVNLDKLADIYEDRLYLPVGLNRPQQEVDAKREQAQAMAQRQQALQETLPAMAGAMKDAGLQMKQQQS